VTNTLLPPFRIVALLEGASFLLLLFVAMPLKYLAGLPLAVRIVGMGHGLLFIAYLLLLGLVASFGRWPLSKIALGVGASLIPFGPFWFEAKLRREATGEGTSSAT
jgi:integral membrane protein